MIIHSPVIAAAAVPAAGQQLADRLDYLDGWRGLAIVLVLQSHFLPSHAIDSGQLGVDIFFCLSGLLMSNLLFVKRVSLVHFYKRRISRILPAFLLFITVVYGLAAWRASAVGGTRSSPRRSSFAPTCRHSRTSGARGCRSAISGRSTSRSTATCSSAC